MQSKSSCARPGASSSRGREGGDVLAPVPSNIRMIWASSGDADIVSRMRNASLGRLYRERLKQYTIVRAVARWAWWNLFPVYVRLTVRLKKRYPIATLTEYVKRSGATRYTLVDAERVKTDEPKVYPVKDQHHVSAPPAEFRFPEIAVATVRHGTVMGGTNLVLVDGNVICHDLYDFQRDATAEEMHGRALVSPGAKKVRLVCRDKQPLSLPVAATFVDACAPNYAHWMTEVLPRLALFCAEERFKAVPVVVNEGLHPNIMESLLLVAGVDREVITLPIGKSLAIDELYVTSVAGYVPFERRIKKGTGHSHGMFSPRALQSVRDHLAEVMRKANTRTLPRKVFLRRNSGVRKVTNAVEIERLLADRGYVVVEPEGLSFIEQAQLFGHARVIVGPTGAGFANAIFCRKEAQVAILISKCQDLAYRYWVNMLTPIGVKFSYVLGDIVDNHEYGVHGDFAVDTSYLMEFIDDLEHN